MNHDLEYAVIRRTEDGTDCLDKAYLFPHVVDLLSSTPFSKWFEEGYRKKKGMVETTSHSFSHTTNSVKELRESLSSILHLLKAAVVEDWGVHQKMVDNLVDDTSDLFVYTTLPTQTPNVRHFCLVNVSIERTSVTSGIVFKRDVTACKCSIMSMCGSIITGV